METRRWIVGPAFDGVFFLGSVLAVGLAYGAYHLLAARIGPQASALWVYVGFSTLFDGPHIAQTFSRTHADPVEFARHRRLHLWLIPVLLLVGWAATLGGQYTALVLAVGLFGNYHIMRQNVGFLRAYAGVGGAPSQGRLGTYLFTTAWVVSAVVLYLRYKDGGPLGTSTGWGVPIAYTATLFACGGFAFDWLRRRRLHESGGGAAGNPVAVVFFVLTLSVTTLVHIHAELPLLMVTVLGTIYHNIQYQGWIYHFQRRRFAKGMVWWLAGSLVYGALYGLGEYFSITHEATLTTLIAVSFLMVTTYHYFIDGVVWRFSSQEELRPVLANS